VRVGAPFEEQHAKIPALLVTESAGASSLLQMLAVCSARHLNDLADSTLRPVVRH
jgi:hypothetical protein